MSEVSKNVFKRLNSGSQGKDKEENKKNNLRGLYPTSGTVYLIEFIDYMALL